MLRLVGLYGRQLVSHFGALLGALAPYVAQLTTGRVGWQAASATSSAVIVSWLLGNAHVHGKLAGTIVNDIEHAVAGLLGGGKGLSGPQSLLSGLLGTPTTGGGLEPLGEPPAGLAGLFGPKAAAASATCERFHPGEPCAPGQNHPAANLPAAP